MPNVRMVESGLVAAELTVIGGGLAGCEAAWQAASQGMAVRLLEMRPGRMTGAHETAQLAELVCSNSLGSRLPDRASGILLEELRRLGSLLAECAEESAVPAGGALAVDRSVFASLVSERIEAHAGIVVERREATEIPDGWVVLASGPLTSPALAARLAELTDEQHLYFFDAIAPIVEGDSLDRLAVYPASRYDRGQSDEGDYLNCALNEDEYRAFVGALVTAERIPLRAFEEAVRQGVRAGMAGYFEGCLPIEILAERGEQSLAFGPMRPVGLKDPRTGRRPHAVLQLRREDTAGRLYNLVGFQTNLTYTEQARVFRMIPGLAKARFVRYGQMHRNTFVNAPRVLQPSLQLKTCPEILVAGQLTGVEGYLGNIATGLLAGRNAARLAAGQAPWILPETTMLGALVKYVTGAEARHFQPMKANLGLLPPLDGPPVRSRRERASALARRASLALGEHAIVRSALG